VDETDQERAQDDPGGEEDGAEDGEGGEAGGEAVKDLQGGTYVFRTKSGGGPKEEEKI